MKYFLAVFLFVGAITAMYFFTNERPVLKTEESDRQVYRSERYGYTFNLPSEFSTKEYSPESVSVGLATGPDSFDNEASVLLFSTGAEVGFESYDAFVFETLRNMCAADGPSATIYCDSITNVQPFTAVSGLEGEVLYLNRTEENFATDEKTIDGFGPVFTFNVSGNVGTAQYAFIAIVPPSNLATEEVNSFLLREIADSFYIDLVPLTEAPEPILALVADIRIEDNQTYVVFDPVVWLQDEEAVAAAIEDTECAEGNIHDCVATLNNNFYIRNTYEEESVYPVAAIPSVAIMIEATSTIVTLGDADQRLEELGPLPFWLTIENDTVTGLAELYHP